MFENFFPEILWIIFAVFVFLRRILKNQPPTSSKPQTPHSSDEFVTSTLEPHIKRVPIFTDSLVQPTKVVVAPPRINSRIEGGFSKQGSKSETTVPTSKVLETPSSQPFVSLEQQKILNGIVFSMILAPRKYEQKPRDFTKI